MKKILTFLFTIITIAGFSQSITVTVGGISGASVANTDSLGNKAPSFYADTLNDQNLFGSKIFKDDLVLDSTLSIGVSSPNASAILDITSTVKGMLQPRMTEVQRDAISTPAEGLEVYDLTGNVPNFYNGTAWRRFTHTTAASLEEGGIVISELAGGASLITDSDNFFWDNTATKLGIGTSSPAHNLHLVGNFALGDTTTGDIDAIIYFGDDGDVTAESFMWNDGDSKFELTDDIKIDGDVYTTSWTTYGGTSTIVGWTSNTSTLINYKKMGNLVFIQFYIDGVSDATNVTFTLPFTQINTNGIELKVAIQVGDNSTQSTTSGLLTLSPNSAMVSCFLDMAGASWTASNNKRVQGQFWYESVP